MKSQTQKILDHLKSGEPIANDMAFKRYNCTRLGSVIERLRRQGHSIRTELIPFTHPCGARSRFAVYTLEVKK